ncbi:hypothetical protein [Pseudomonas nitroreducens]|uniref:hypothetical protein n=1 Tax=Pseudomonas nitroreducens TaxID=46680 RepID=UPI00351CDD6E
MDKPTVSLTMDCANQAVIWQPYIEDRVGAEPAILVQRDSTGLLSIEQEGKAVLVAPETLPELVRQLRRLAKEGEQP